MRILAADDAASIRMLLELHLGRAGHSVELAADGRAALDKYFAGRYDLLMLDLQMPVLDGWAAVRELRAWEAENGRVPVPVLALSGSAEPGEAERCRDAGCTGTLSKPFTREELLAAVAGAAGGAPPAPETVQVDPDFADLIPGFLDGCRAELAEMRRSLARVDFDALARAAHRLAGSGASYGFAGITESARRVERAAKSADPAGAGGGLDALAAYLGRIKVRYE